MASKLCCIREVATIQAAEAAVNNFSTLMPSQLLFCQERPGNVAKDGDRRRRYGWSGALKRRERIPLTSIKPGTMKIAATAPNSAPVIKRVR